MAQFTTISQIVLCYCVNRHVICAIFFIILQGQSMSSLSIVGISGSLRSGSFNTSLLRYVSTILPENVQYTELSIADIPLYNADIQAEGYPEAVAAFRDGIAAADGILIVSPEYNYTIPGSLKNAIDWASRPPAPSFSGKPVGLLSASTGIFGGVRGQAQLRYIMFAVNAIVMNRPEIYVASAAQKFDADGILTDQTTKDLLAKYVDSFMDWVNRIGRK